ncbi:hypothetical protein THRCLA_01277 [Thraustotheca clavata]|uniref:Uncharacterized protein n=1 Tax=Thraustotheca clavata TaxID=74557 RepID=A0A1W0A8T7_9STRA|nr:hypothetical protein THRCLA_01277 [Thraustotheca clavata]
MVMCMFNGCPNAALPGPGAKCDFHKNRKMCCVKGCSNQVYARNLCVRHGGRKACRIQGCTNTVRGGDLCLHHGGPSPKRYCTVQGCLRQAHARQKCVRHGGGNVCKVPGCFQYGRVLGLCHRHNKSQQKNIENLYSSEDMIDHSILSLLVQEIPWTRMDWSAPVTPRAGASPTNSDGGLLACELEPLHIS